MSLQTKLFINGKFVDSQEGSTIKVLNPHDDSQITEVSEAKAPDIDDAVAAAKKAFPAWRDMQAAERGRLLLKLADLIEEKADELAEIESLDTGHPIRDTTGLDVPRTAFTYRYFGGMADKLQGSIIPVEPGFLNYVTREPVGVVGQITPWNFPSTMITRKCAPALAVGCSVVIKPASQTPFSALALAVLAEQAGFPQGVFNIVTGSANEIGKELTENPIVKKISFTGSTEVGKILLKQSSSTVKKVSMELGGHAPFIVFDDANVDEAVIGVMQSKFRNSGQTCICANRIFVHEKIYDEFLNKFIKEVEKIKVGNGLDSNTNSGPLIDQYSLEKVKEHVKDAVNETGADSDGEVEVRSGCTSVGQGLEEVLETIAATSLGVDRQRVRYVLMDSDFSLTRVDTIITMKEKSYHVTLKMGIIVLSLKQ